MQANSVRLLDNQTWQTGLKTVPLAKVQLCEYENQTGKLLLCGQPFAQVGKRCLELQVGMSGLMAFLLQQNLQGTSLLLLLVSNNCDLAF